LQVIARQRGTAASAEDRAALKAAQAEIPAYPDVRPGLERLRRAGFRLAALTNSTKEAATKLLGNAGIGEMFEEILSADAVERYKPSREAYEYAARTLNVTLGEIVLVAAHGWDIAGALSVGCNAVFVARPGKALSPGSPDPQFRARDVAALAEQLVSEHA
jgi:2-haloacid dehalogenase